MIYEDFKEIRTLSRMYDGQKDKADIFDQCLMRPCHWVWHEAKDANDANECLDV